VEAEIVADIFTVSALEVIETAPPVEVMVAPELLIPWEPESVMLPVA
jgi:hypothetical protein